MKNIRTFSLAAVTILLVNVSTQAQTKFGTLNFDIGFATGKLADNYAMIMFGGGFGYEMPVGSKLGVGASIGYTFLRGKEVTDPNSGYYYETESSYFIPIQAIGKYYFIDPQDGFYAGLHAGIHMYEQLEYNGDPWAPDYTATATSSFSWAPCFGFVGTHFDMSLRLQFISTPDEATSYIGFRAGYFLFSNH